ncbi:MAG TPA: hypothetical protein VJ746_04790 [Nitrospira sp.]|nr:hypothetical protein [Nitrospira sp.]
MRRAVFAALLISFLSADCPAQVQTGVYAHGAFDAKTFDTINIGNLNVYFALPVYSKPGRGGLGFYYNLAYNSSVWTPVTSGGTTTWTPVFNWGWTANTDAHTGYLDASVLQVGTCTVNGHKVAYEVWGKYVYVDPIGVGHHFKTSGGQDVEVSNEPTCTGIPSQGAGTATDSSGLTLNTSGQNGTITTPAGKIAYAGLSGNGSIANGNEVITAPYNSLNASGSTVDSNGNVISINTSGQIEDTTGNVIVTVSGTAPNPTTYTYTDTSGTQRSVTVNYSSYNVQTAFGCSGVSEFAKTSEYLISSISYPDGTSYSFGYEPTPGYPSYVTGRLASVTLPEGGEITYTYSGGGGGYGIVCPNDTTTTTLTRKMPNDPDLTPFSVRFGV